MNLYTGGFGVYQEYVVADSEQEAIEKIGKKMSAPYLPITASVIDDIDGFKIVPGGATGLAIPDTGIGDLSDGYHTFNELYHHRAILFSVICNQNPEKAWKSKLHSNGTMYDGMFIVGIETECGNATYHYDIEPYWDMFNVEELQAAPEWDGHTPTDAINRIKLIGAYTPSTKRIEPESDGLRHCKKCDFSCDNQGDLLKHYREAHPNREAHPKGA